MNRNQLARRSARYYFASHLGVLAGAAVASAILAGALIVGDSVRESLREQALARLAGGAYALAAQDRFFQADLLDRLAKPAATAPPQVQPWLEAAPEARGFCALDLAAAASRADDSARANRVRALGVDPTRFPALAGALPDQVWLNAALARQLHAEVGDAVVLRVRKPGALSGDTAITPRDDASFALRLKVAGVLTAQQGGDLALSANQQGAMNAWVRIDTLAAAAGIPGRANLALARWPGSGEAPGALGPFLEARLREAFQLEDAELSLRVVAPAAGPGGTAPPACIELGSRRIFLDPAAAGIAEGIPFPQSDGKSGDAPARIVTYLVNSLEAHGALTPYSMVTAAGPPYTPPGLKDDEVVVVDWLADDLRLSPGDALRVRYYQVDAAAQLVERDAVFKVRSITPMQGPAADGTLMPDFPGVAKAESTHDWNSGFELVHPLRDKDELYWKKWRGAPKAFISPEAGRRLWGNRFGDWTALRWIPTQPAPPAALEGQRRAIAEALRGRLAPAELGFAFQPVRTKALEAAAGGQDFGGLFLGFSFFLIVSALLLISLLFRFALEQRAGEVGLLLALGWPARQVRGVLFREGLWIAGAGALIGAIAGSGYAWAILEGLATIWKDAAAGARLELHLTPQAVIGGAALGAACAAATLWLGLRRRLRRPARDLLAQGRLESPLAFGGRRRVWAEVLGWLLLLSGAGWTGAVVTAKSVDPGGVFGAGSLLLMGGVLAMAGWLHKVSRPGKVPAALGALALRSLARRPGRTLGAAGLLAGATFLLGAVGANKRDAAADATRRGAGAGGFALWAESSLPVYQDLNTARGRDFYGLDAAKLQGAAFVPLRVRNGDDASCLNLNRASRPRLLAVDPAALAKRGAFTFSEVAKGSSLGEGWGLLQADPPGGDVIPAVGDAESIEWILHKSIGDNLDYVDEHGRPFKVKIVGGLDNSVLQGSLIVAERDFVRLFPGEGGYRAFLIDAPKGQATGLAAELSRAMRDTGLEVTGTMDRLSAFNAVQNTYLDTFEVLGGLGLLLGSAGLGIVVRRNLQERRGEFSLLLAVGFPPRRVLRLIWWEHLTLVGFGLGCGAAAALPAVLPSALRPGSGTPWASFGLMLGVVAVNAAVWIWVAARSALRVRVQAGLQEL